jgi:2-polyprenyl-6-methoxyphenol hydroxylase-like FAD-dependent oxidoreductase
MRVSSIGTKSYQLLTRVGPKRARKLKRLTIGRFPAMSLADARKKAQSMLLLVEEGRDPKQVEIEHEAQLERELAEKQKAAALAREHSFAAVRAEFIELHVKPKLKPAVAGAYERTLNRAQFAEWEDRDIRTITKKEITRLFGAWAKVTPTMANRALDYTKSMFTWAIDEMGILEVSQAAGVSKPGAEPGRDRVLSPNELQLLWQGADAAKRFEPIVRLLVLTGQRRTETALMKWSDLALGTDTPTWNIPAANAKNGDGVTLVLQSGERIKGRALIGCDGMWSKIRDTIVGDGKPRVSGHIAYRAVLKRDEVPADLWQPDVILWAGPRTHLVHYPLRRGELYNLVAVFHSDRYVEGWNAEADAGELWARFQGQRPEVLRMLERIETWRMWVLCDREPVKDWSKGRVTLLGDAAHPMLQYLAQGACMATEDAVRLADEVAEQPHDLPAAFRAYVAQRYLRTARVQIMARVYGDFYHARGPAAELRNQMLGAHTPEQSHESISWLYGGM